VASGSSYTELQDRCSGFMNTFKEQMFDEPVSPRAAAVAAAAAATGSGAASSAAGPTAAAEPSPLALDRGDSPAIGGAPSLSSVQHTSSGGGSVGASSSEISEHKEEGPPSDQDGQVIAVGSSNNNNNTNSNNNSSSSGSALGASPPAAAPACAWSYIGPTFGGGAGRRGALSSLPATPLNPWYLSQGGSVLYFLFLF
jgi:hypothetical protein